MKLKVVQDMLGHCGIVLTADTRGVCSTNAIEGVNARIRRAVKARGRFPTEQATLKCVYLAVMALDPTGKPANAGPPAGRPP